MATGETVEGYTLNHESPGPLIRAQQGDLVEVTLINDSITGGVALHWHGVDVPNAEDGVAGVTQDAVRPGEQHVYRFVAEDPGSYWYHSHQVSHEQVRGGLFGVLVVNPAEPDGCRRRRGGAHLRRTARPSTGPAGRAGDRRAGPAVRVRVVNTDNGPLASRSSASSTGCSPSTDATSTARPWSQAIGAGPGRRPRGPRVRPRPMGQPYESSSAPRAARRCSSARRVHQAPTPTRADGKVDLLSYGSPAPLGFDPADADRRFDYSIGRRPGFLDGKPGLRWTINGHLFPDVPMFMVTRATSSG